VDQLGRLPALREADRPQAARRQLREEPRGLAEALARSPSSASSSGGFQMTTSRSARRRRRRRRSRLAGQVERELAGFAIVADASRNCGSAP
jgi:hypothetical protein